ncbi:hypothetical protein C1Y63_01090 [Corynebacterium sp. 13CS0277]|uniref:hypothetical protein n=1 Tax=Corynebacterium sp. 13CS0277 TaxID=2071994 RepID=UPI000D02B18C|nr:hypothetical protein [Corynebacterium sp. 13CS0277]PRQ12416.1 hypothetical protein C1Y63_01090 [Corynebacterium sp. 13CS0277]
MHTYTKYGFYAIAVAVCGPLLATMSTTPGLGITGWTTALLALWAAMFLFIAGATPQDRR